jgi:hypothetical protein
MTARLSTLLILAAFLAAPLSAKDKNKPIVPDYVLKAQTVRVIIDPEAGEPLNQPNANAVARDNVEKALSEWGRLRPMMEGMGETDLLIVVRTASGKAMQPTIKGGPIDQRGGVAQSTDSTIRIGGRTGQNPNADPNMDPMNRSPHVSNEIGPSEDTFAVYRGDISGPLDAPPVWRYIAKDCLRAPRMAAVEEFRKALAEADQQRQQTKKP